MCLKLSTNFKKKDPATRTFQAIRMHINRELGELEDGLDAAERALKPGGRLAVVTFHSLEDRLVKNFMRMRSGSEPAGSRHLPMRADGPKPTFERVAKPVRATDAEIARNPRARSATLRSAQRTAALSFPRVSRDAACRAKAETRQIGQEPKVPRRPGRAETPAQSAILTATLKVLPPQPRPPSGRKLG